MLCQFSIFPVGAGESLSASVAGIIDIIDKSGIPYQTHSLGTIVEGDWETVMDLIRRCHEVIGQDNARVVTNIHIDDRKGADNRIEGKIKSLENHLGRKISR